MRIKRGDVFHVKIYDNNTVGHEQKKSRPAVIVSANENNYHASTFEVVFLTTKLKNSRMPTHVELHSIRRLQFISTALCESITTVDFSRLGEYYGYVSHEEMEKVDEAILIGLFGYRKIINGGGENGRFGNERHGRNGEKCAVSG